MCFKEVVEGVINGRIFPAGCYSGSCTKPASQELKVYVDHEMARLDFQYTFIIEDYSSYFDFICTEDCGAGLIVFTIDRLTEKSYEVWVGGNLIGEVDLPSEPFCIEVGMSE